MNRQRTLDASLEQVLFEVKRVIVGQDALLERMMVALLARGHLLVEGVPGLAKTMAVKTLAQAIGGEFQRIQFTPDLVPADIVGTRVFNQKLGEFQVSLGPVVREPRAGRRGESRAREGAERPAGGDAGAAGHDRPGDPSVARPLPRDGDAEPDRVRGHVPAARGAGRPLHAQGADRLSEPHGGVRDRRAHDRRARGSRVGPSTRSSSSGSSGLPTRSSSIPRSSSTRSSSRTPRATSPRSGSASWRPTSRTGRARARRST